jgi:hypothetical protein
MARKNKKSMTHSSFYLPPEIVRLLEKDSKDIGVSKSAILRSILEAHYHMQPNPSIPQHRPHRELENHISRIVKECMAEQSSSITNMVDEKMNLHRESVTKLMKEHLKNYHRSG